MSFLRHVGLYTACLICAFLLHLLLAQLLIALADRLYPRQSSALGTIGVVIAPHPLTGGLFMVPLTAFVLYAYALNLLRRKRLLGFSPRADHTGA